MSTRSIIQELATTRFKACCKRSKQLGIEPPLLDDFIEVMTKCYDQGAKCCYCNRPLHILSTKPLYLDAYSIDHKIPLSEGGTNKIENLAVCCAGCNLAKKTLTAEMYEKTIAAFWIAHYGQEFIDEWIRQMSKGSLADKIERVRKEMNK